MNSAEPSLLQLTARASGMARRGQGWFYADDLLATAGEPGRLVRVADEAGRDLGLGFTSQGKLALRLAGPWPADELPSRELFFAARLAAALRARPAAREPAAALRLVHGEADQLPGLVIDRYAGVVVVQATTAYVESALDAIVPWLVAELTPESVVARHDLPVRAHEGLPQEIRLLHGRRIEEVVFREHGIAHTVRPLAGHKTGFYLDQRPARALVRDLAHGRRVLDLFCYQGGFALNALAGGAAAVVAVDQSATGLAAGQQAVAANSLPPAVWHEANVFDFLRAARQQAERYDLIILDPPAFARSRRELSGAEHGYRDLNRQALRLLAPAGYLLTCTCSHHVDWARFESIVRQAAAGLPFRVVLRQRLGAGPDHPALVTHPESEYLKLLLLQRLD